MKKVLLGILTSMCIIGIHEGRATANMCRLKYIEVASDGTEMSKLYIQRTRRMIMQRKRGTIVQVHYESHKPEPHILLFRRLQGTNPLTGQVEPRAAKEV